MAFSLLHRSRWLASLTSVLPYPTISSSTRRMALGSLERMITLSFEEANIEQEVCSRQTQRVRAIIFFMAYGGDGEICWRMLSGV